MPTPTPTSGGAAHSPGSPTIRRARTDESRAVADLYWTVRRENVPTIPAPVHDLDSVRWWMREIVFDAFEVWVAEEDGQLVGLMVLRAPDVLDQLYVARRAIGHGVGARFLSVARHTHPDGLRLWTFQSNARARRFYERHGFRPVAWTEGDNEEGAPDVEYVWRP